ncbi:MAG: thymidine kinase [Bacilli bacterium]|nr:thymidine kinase [Bacilli bacterium]
MVKLNFKYATMNAGKSIDLIRTAYNYEENGFKVLVMKPAIDTKADDYVISRIGISRKVDYLIDGSVYEVLKGKLDGVNCILIDEAQFLSKEQVDELYMITKAFDIPVIAFGLKVNFKGELFEGSKRLIELGEELSEIPTMCACGEIARMVGRKVNGEYTLDGEEVVIDGSEEKIEYIPLCGKCYLEKVMKKDFKKFARKMR